MIKRITLEISTLDDIEPIEIRKNCIALYVFMDKNQIKRNIEALKELLTDKEIAKLRVV